MKQYWVVGAMFGGKDDALNKFISRGYWYCWDQNESFPQTQAIAKQQEKFKKIEIGDRLAVKKLLEKGSKEIEIRAIGIVRDVDHSEWRVYVNWLPIIEPDQKRRVPLNGCAAAIHGPFKEDDPWVQKVFSA